MLNSGFLLPDIVTAQLAYGATILSFLGKRIDYFAFFNMTLFTFIHIVLYSGIF